jgi:hypothetical protein
MTYHVLQIDSNQHKGFLAEGRQDPLTKKKISAGDMVVICAGCQGAFLEDSWQLQGKEHCKQSNTLRTIPAPRSNRRFSSKKTPKSNFIVTRISKNGQSSGASASTNAQSAGTYTSTNAQSVTPPAAPPNGNLNPAVPIFGGIFVVFLGFVLISLIGFAAVRFTMSGNDSASVNSSSASANKNNNRVYSNNSPVNRNNSVYTNTNKVSNVNTSTYSPSYSSSGCRLYNDKSNENKVFIRSECDVYDCDTDESRVIESLPDNTRINIIKGVSRVKSKVKPYSWIKVEIIDTGQIVWVADSKIKCD